MSKLLCFASGVAFLLPGSEVFANGFRQGGWDGHMWGGGMMFGPLMMFVLFVLFIVVVVFLVRWITGQGQGSSSLSRNSAMDILNERYAKGEIDKEEYEERKSVLLS